MASILPAPCRDHAFVLPPSPAAAAAYAGLLSLGYLEDSDNLDALEEDDSEDDDVAALMDSEDDEDTEVRVHVACSGCAVGRAGGAGWAGRRAGGQLLFAILLACAARALLLLLLPPTPTPTPLHVVYDLCMFVYAFAG